MKKNILCLILCALFCICVGFTACKNGGGQDKQSAKSLNYSARFSEGVPEDWEIYSKSDAAHSSAEAGENAAVLSHSNLLVNAKIYHGGVYKFASALGNVADFELSLTFRFLSYDNESRWFCVYYHTRETEGKMSGYLMNVRVSGTSAQSTVSAVPAYTDTENVDSGITLSDNSFHTLGISVKDGVAVHRLDGNVMLEYDLASKSGLLGGYNADGGFAIGVNRCSVEISSLTVNGKAGNESSYVPEIAETYSPETSLVAAPTVITRINGAEQLNALKEEVRPSTAIISLNDKGQVVAGKKVLGSLSKIYEEYFGGRVIPAVNVQTEKQAARLTEWLNQTGVFDISVISTEAELVKKVRTAVPWVRGIVDYSNVQKAPDMAHIVEETTSSFAHIAVLSQKYAYASNVEYLQARFKTVWVQSENPSEFAASAIVSSGAYGIITDSVENAYSALKSYTQSNSMARMPFNIGHRGLPNASYENSVEGALKAFEAGATHVEIDLKLTADKRIVIMHDDQISRTTNGHGLVNEMTLSELRNYKIIKSYDGKIIGAGVNIPTLEEFFEAFKDTDLVLVLEIKTSDPEIIPVLKDITEKYDYFGNIAVIAFDIEQIAEMKKVMPQTPTADLNGVSSSDIVSVLYKFTYYNTVMDTGYGNAAGAFLNRQLLDRGYTGFMWTYGNASEISTYFTSGVLGMTNNDATAFSSYVNKLSADGRYLPLSQGQSLGEAVTAVAETYGGDKTEVIADVFKKSENGSEIILSYRSQNPRGVQYTVYSQAVKVVDAEAYVPVKELIKRINELPKKVGKADKKYVERLQAAYSLLYEDDKAEVYNYKKLSDAVKRLGSTHTTLIIVLLCCCAAAASTVTAVLVVLKRKRKK